MELTSKLILYFSTLNSPLHSSSATHLFLATGMITLINVPRQPRPSLVTT